MESPSELSRYPGHTRFLHVVVDLTLLLPGGMNGGIKPGFFGLFAELRRQEGASLRCTFLTNSWSHGDLTAIRQPGDVAICIKALEGRAPDLAMFEPSDYANIDPPIGWIAGLHGVVYYNPLCEEIPDVGGLPMVILHPDVLHRDIPSSLPSEEVERRERYFLVNTPRATRIQTISEFSRSRIEAFYPVARGKVFVTHLPVQSRLAAADSTQSGTVSGSYFYYPANFWRHKNHDFLLESYTAYVRHSGEGAWKLVLTGNDDSGSQKFMHMVAERGLSGMVRFLGHLPDAEQAALFRNAGALVFPSLYEGFGIPPLEAMSAGIPVLCSDAGSLPEVVQDGAMILPGSDVTAWADALQHLSGSQELRDTLKANGRIVVEGYSLAASARLLGCHLRECAQLGVSKVGLSSYHSTSHSRSNEKEESLANHAQTCLAGVSSRVIPEEAWRDEDLPLISIVVPSLNQERFLERCLDSLLAQNYPALECVVMDGGSTDGSVDILRRYAERIRWQSAADGGQAAAINSGLATTSGDILGYLNSDDALPVGALHHVGRYFLEHPGVDMVYGKAQVIDEDDNYLRDYVTKDWDWESFRSACHICQPATFFRRSIFSNVGEFNEKIRCSIDYEYWIRVWLAGGIIRHEPVMLGYSRDYRETKTRRLRPIIYHEIVTLQLDLVGRAHRQWWYEYICCLKWEIHSRLQWMFPSRLKDIRRLAAWLESCPRLARLLLHVGLFSD